VLTTCSVTHCGLLTRDSFRMIDSLLSDKQWIKKHCDVYDLRLGECIVSSHINLLFVVDYIYISKLLINYELLTVNNV